MSQVWLCIPSCRPISECGPRFEKWSQQGYRIALLRQGDSVHPLVDFEIYTPRYLGWAASTNILAARVLQLDSSAQWIVGGGDDTLPDPHHSAEEIAVQCEKYFDASQYGARSSGRCTFGVMQPTGHGWGDDVFSRAQWGEDAQPWIDRIAGSPWMGCEWCQRGVRR